MPRARAMAAGRRVGSLRAARAKEMPTAIPSGMLCMAMASTSRVLRRPEPSRGAWRKAGVRWGRRVFMVTRNRTPRTEPPAAGNHPGSPASSAASMAGMSRDHMLAAIITPAAKPSRS